MATGENVLWLVFKQEKLTKLVTRRWVFRTRDAAQSFADYKEAKAKVFRFTVHRATWGDER